MCAGIVGGAVGLPLLMYFYHWFVFPSVLHDGQYIMVSLGTAFVGMILGAITSYAVKSRESDFREAGIACIGGSAFIIVLFLGSGSWQIWAAALPLIMWAISLLCWGFQLLQRDGK